MMKRFNFFKRWLAQLQTISKLVIKLIDWALLFSIIVVILVMVYDFGFDDTYRDAELLKKFYTSYISFYLCIGIIRMAFNFFHPDKPLRQKIFEFLLLVLFGGAYELMTGNWNWKFASFFYEYYPYFIFPLFIVVFFYSISKNAISFYKKNMNPAVLLVLTFFVLSGVGTLGLLLPNSTVDGISYIDALFTSVSAVCITGLIVVDTAETFTFFGQGIILLLMQLGGLGVMTFAGLLGKMFASGVSFQQQMILKETILGDKLSEVMKTIYKIILITFLVEGIGAVGIYLSTWEYPFEDEWHRIFFAVFHSVSAFCNAGFVLAEEGMLHPYIEMNYSFQLVIAVLFIMGGIGFPVVFAFYSQIKNFFRNIFRKIFFKKRFHHLAHTIGVNSRLMIWSSFVLTIVSILFIALFEWDNTLSHHSFFGKVVGLFFTAATPRSAGFNVVDMTAIAYPTALFYMLMMWIGASPGGTGGGVKTTTFSISLLNFWNIAKGKENVNIFGREVGQESLRRAYAIISLSIVLMGLFTFLVYSFDGQLALIHIVFEVFSAFNNCGLSLGSSGEFSAESKFILSLAMFAGRVGTLTLLSAFLYKKRKNNYQYPSQEIIF